MTAWIKAATRPGGEGTPFACNSPWGRRSSWISSIGRIAHQDRAGDSLIRCAGGWLAISEMKHGLLLFQFDYDLFCPFDSELIADRTSDLAKSFNRPVDRRALVTHGELPREAGAQNSLSPAV